MEKDTRKKQNDNNVSADHKMTNEKKENNKENQKENSKATKKENSVKEPEKGGFDASALLELVKKYKRYIAAGVLFVAMIVILAKCTGPVTDTPKEPVVDEQTADRADQPEEFQVDAIPEINELIGSYYTAYAAGDVAALEALAQPISDTEKSYIQVFSEYVDSYENISCHTKTGLKDGEYVVSVYLEMKFKDVATAAPGLDFFYLRTNESGKLYIDNAYSQFNQSNMEESTEADVQALINEFEQAKDVSELQTEVQQKYEQAIAADSDLDKMANETIPNAIAAWVQSLTQEDPVAEQPGEEEKPAEENPKDNPADAEKPEEEKPEKENPEETDENSDGKAKTAYTIDGINLRKGAGTDHSVVSQIPLGAKIKIYPATKKDGWVKAVYDGKKGYVKLEFVTTKKSEVPSGVDTDSDEPVKALPEGAEITLSDSVNVRVSMSETAEKVGLAYQGDVVKIIMSYAEGWTKVEWNGQTGYIKTELIK